MTQETEQMRVTPGNAEQAKAWDGDEGEQWAASPERYDRAIQRHNVRFREAAAVQATDDVLDVGCGNGESALEAARAGASAFGVDCRLG
jgi:cyclopropane fatty-acyl-phospholipid synthase-like methyltransferase